MDPSTCQKKVQNLLSMSLHSAERSITSIGEARSEEGGYENGRYLRDEYDEEEERVYKTDSVRKKVKTSVPHQIDSFNSFAGINMINEMIKNKNRLASANKSINTGLDDRSAKKNGGGHHSHMKSSTRHSDPKVIDFHEEISSGEKAKRSSMKNLRGSSKGKSDAAIKGEY